MQNSMQIVDNFSRLYYDSKGQTWRNTYWIGNRTWKCPLDLWIYQEIVVETKPDVIIECGMGEGGTTLYLATVCNLIGHGEIISIDLKERKRLKHDRIKFLLGDSISDEVVKQVSRLIPGKTVMVILDSTHVKPHVLKELEIYSKFVTKGNYLIVEDTLMNGHPIKSSFGEGPMEAVTEFLSKNSNFVIDKSREKFYLTFNPNGYLRRIADEIVHRDSGPK